MIREDSKDPFKMLLIQNQQPIQALGTNGAHEPFRDAVRLWGTKRRANDFRPVLRKTSSKLSVNFWSRSRMRKRTCSWRSAKAHVSCRACCVTHGAVGFAVEPARCTRRLLNSMKNSTYSRCSQIVSTVKKSTAIMLCR